MKDVTQTDNQPMISVVLIACILLSIIIFVNSADASENDTLLMVVWLFPCLTLLTLGYVVIYKTRSGRILLVISIVMSLIVFLIYAYIKGMAAAFQH